MLVMMLAGWLNRDHQDVIEYLKEENKILREKIGKKKEGSVYVETTTRQGGMEGGRLRQAFGQKSPG